MKHIKAFATQAEVATYEQSQQYVEPYIGASYDSVAAHYNHNTPIYKQFYDYDDETHQYNLYEQVEYIENPSNAYIDTGVNPDNRMHIITELRVMQKVAQIRILGSRGSLIGLEIYTNGKSNASTLFAYSFRDIKDGDDWVSTGVYSSDKIKIVLDTTPTQNAQNKTGLTIYDANGTLLKYTAPKYWINASPNATYSYDTSVTIAICGFNYVSGSAQYLGNSSKLRIYSFSILNTRTNTYTRDFIPVKRINDNVYGLWDKVEGKFYISPNGTQFTGGAKMIYDTNDVQYQQVEYIENTSTAYIDTNIQFNLSMEISGKFQNMDNTTSERDRRYFGGATTWRGYGLSVTENSIMLNETLSVDANIKTYNVSTPFEIHYKNKSVTVNNYTVNLNTTNGNSTEVPTMYLLAEHRPNTAAMSFLIGRLYYFKIYNENILIRDFIPVKRVSDSKYGLFDCINKQFYTSQTEVDFTGG